MKTIKYFFGVMNFQTLVVASLAVGSTYFCLKYQYIANLPTGLIGLAVVFPIVFSINTAYRRRESALRDYSDLRSHAVALYYAHRDWARSIEETTELHTGRVRGLIEGTLGAVRDYLREEKSQPKLLNKVLHRFSEISMSHEELRKVGVPANEISRANQYLSKVMVAFERMRNIANYRTPMSLRAYSTVFLSIFPIAFGPYFAHLCLEAAETFYYVGYMVAVLYALVLVTLDNIQDDLENPFDGIGVDDVRLDVFDEYKEALSN